MKIILWIITLAVIVATFEMQGEAFSTLYKQEVETNRMNLVIKNCPDNTGMYSWIRDWCDKEINKIRDGK